MMFPKRNKGAWRCVFGICECCGFRTATQMHHKFSQTKWAKRLYGQLIHDPENIMQVCADCHTSHQDPRLIHWSESEFCQALGIEPRSKTAKVKELA